MKINDFAQSGKIYDSTKALDEKKVTGENEESTSFLNTLKEKLDKINDDQLAADSAAEAFIKGDDVDIHEVMLVGEEAKLSLQMAIQVRNKLVEAYQELNRMQL